MTGCPPSCPARCLTGGPPCTLARRRRRQAPVEMLCEMRPFVAPLEGLRPAARAPHRRLRCD
eukprot:14878981-Alexandrium_andersonii.AAC.1